MDSPMSESIPTRFSTPASDLDDHRRYPESIPRPEMSTPPQGSYSRHGPGHASGNRINDRPVLELPQTSQMHGDHSTTVRDFEEAIIDDDKSVREGGNTSLLAPDYVSPGRSRRPTLRLPTPSEGAPGKSRTSSMSSSTSSAPNSVDAFADPRRRERAGTVNSVSPSELDVRPNRTASATSQHRRMTFSNESTHQQKDVDDCSCKQVRAEDDTGYPVADELSKSFVIDYEALEEFVAENKKGSKTERNDSKVGGITLADKMPRVFNDMRLEDANNAPKVTSGGDFESAGPGLSEKQTIVPKSPMLMPKLNHSFSSDPEDSPSVTRFSFFSSELESTIHAAELGDLMMPGETFRDIFDPGLDGGVWWLDMCNPTASEVDAICRAFAVHPLTNEDIKTQEAREKVELFKQYYFVCFRSFHQTDKDSESYMDPVNVYLVVFREGVLSFTFCQSPHGTNVRRRIGELRDYFSLSSDWICYAMIDNIVDCFGPVIRDIERETDVIEDQVFVARADDFASLLRQIGACRKKSLGLMRLLSGKADVIKGFAKRCNSQHEVAPRGEIGLYLGDIQDHVVTMLSTLSHAEKMLSRSHSNYLAQLSVDNLVQGNRANVVLSKITLIATIIVPLNLICGLFGMNVPVPGRESGGLGWFFGIMGFIVALTATLLLCARRIKFI
ncbi:MAG: Mg(2+) transporter [Vezdaea aestivalis]|nr:MAG: Mg(2+) transporter [Vezdaea aestivalis]